MTRRHCPQICGGAHEPARFLMQYGRSSYIPQIDTLRAIAVLAVLVFHLNGAWLPGGFAGVDVFFVISGYVISASLSRSNAPTLRRFTVEFYQRRLLRILPALLVCVVVTAIFTAVFVPKAWLSDFNYVTLALAMVGLSNFSLMFTGNDYFAPRVDFNPGTHTWSLGVEEQFYFVFPVLCFLWLRNRRRDHPRRRETWALAAISALSLGFSVYASSHMPLTAFYSLPSRFWELGLGALLFQLHSHGRFIANTPRKAMLGIAVALLLLTYGFLMSDARAFPIPWALFATLGSALFIDAVVASRERDSPVMRTLATPLMVGIGKISYSLYLWHWPVYVLFRWTIGLDTTLARSIAVVLAVALAIASYRFIELPVRHHPGLLRRTPGFVVRSGLAVAVLSMSLVWTLSRENSHFSLSVTSATREWYPDVWPLEATQDRACEVGVSNRAMEGGEVIDFERTGACNDRELHDLYVIGDSHATALMTMLSKSAAEDAARVHLYLRAGCGFLRIRSASTGECAEFGRIFTRELLKNSHPGDIVFLPSLRMERIATQFGGKPPKHALSEEQELVLGTREAQQWLDSIQGHGLRVVFMAPTPVFSSPEFRCSDWFNRDNPACDNGLSIDRAETVRRRASVVTQMHRFAERYPDVRVWDPFDLLCPATRCVASRNGHPLFFDGDHLSGYGNLYLYDSFLAEVVRPDHAGWRARRAVRTRYPTG
jgi:peptidoglycan/LPS O-acetylase OafA/YrhL